MKLIDIMIQNNVAWPTDADEAYQSAIDSEIYFLKRREGIIHRTGRNPLPLCDNRGQKGTVTSAEYRNRRNDYDWFLKVKEAGGPTAMKQKERERMIQRIENGLRKDFDIDSREFAVLMFEKGWRK